MLLDGVNVDSTDVLSYARAASRLRAIYGES